MEFKSFGDLSSDIAAGLHKIPTNIDLVVGIPRSGLMAASIIALNLNLKFCDLDSFLANGALKTGSTRIARGSEITTAFDAKNVLFVDDSIATGSSMSRVKAQVADSGFNGKSTFLAIYSVPGSSSIADMTLAPVALPRIFEWNLFHRREMLNCCVDIDGVLCVDPTLAQNDDGSEYENFLLTAIPLARPSYRIGHLVTSRLEKYRRQTEQWLADHQIAYDNLHMLDLPSAAERRRLGAHADFKANVYRSLHDAILFIESEPGQAQEISRLSGKPVLDFGSRSLIKPGHSLVAVTNVGRTLMWRVHRKLTAMGKR